MVSLVVAHRRWDSGWKSNNKTTTNKDDGFQIGWLGWRKFKKKMSFCNRRQFGFTGGSAQRGKNELLQSEGIQI